MVRTVATAFVAALLLAGCYDRFDAPQEQSGLHDANMTIAELHALWFGKPAVINEDMVIAGCVTSSDREMNFYQTFTVSDHTGGVEILAGTADLCNPYPFGCRVNIRLKGCAIDEQNGVLQIGLPAEDYQYGNLAYLQSKVNLDKHVLRDGSTAEVPIPVLHCSELQNSMCGMPVTVTGLERTGGPEQRWEGYVRFEDPHGDSIYTVTSSLASFAGESVPGGKVAITGILLYGGVSPSTGNKHFILKMSSREDCRSDI